MSTGPIFLYNLIFQAHTEPVSTQPETVTEDRWHQPWSEPVRQKIAPALAIALIASGSVWPPTPVQAAVNNGWFEPLSDPVRVKPQLPTPEQQFFAGDTLTIPTSRISWYEPLSEPVRLKIGLPAHLQQYSALDTITIPTSKGMGWFNGLSDPVRTASRLQTGANQDLAFAPTQTQAATILEAAADIAGPTFSRVTQYQSVAWAPQQIAATVSTGWFVPLSEPVRVQRFTTGAQQFLAYTGAAPFPESVTESRWHQPWSEPVRLKPQLPVSDQSFLATEAIPLDQTVTSWFEALSEPVRTRAAQQQQTLAQSLGFTPVSIPWFEALSEPVRTRYFNTALNNDALAFSPQQTAGVEQTLVSKWYQALSEPVRTRVSLVTAAQQAFVFGESAQFPETVTESRWHQPWSEPVRIRPQVAASEQPFVFTEQIPLDQPTSWYSPLSEPVRLRGLLTAQQSAFTSDTAAIPTSKLMPWFGAFTDPVRIKPRLITGANQDLAFPAQFSVEVTLVSKWFEALSEPQRTKPGLFAGSQQNLVHLPFNETTLVSKWFEGLSEPVRIKPSLLTSSQQAFFATAPYAPVELTLVSKWFESLSEPVRFKRGLAAYLQSSYTNDTIAETIKKLARQIPWYAPWREPVRVKPLLRTAANPATAFDPFPIPNNFINASLDTTEQGDSFSGTLVLSGGQPLRAYVSIIENTAQNSIVVSIVEPPPVAPTGLRANVTIIDLGPGIWL